MYEEPTRRWRWEVIFFLFFKKVKVKNKDRAWHHNNSKLSSWDYVLMCHVKFESDSRVQATGSKHHDADQSQLVRGLYIVMVWWHYISNIFVKLWFLTFQLWMSTEIWNFHYYLMKSIMDNWHFVRSVQLCMNVHLAEESSRDSSNNAWHHISSHLSPATAKMIFLWPNWPPFILSGFRRHREALGGSDLMLEKF